MLKNTTFMSVSTFARLLTTVVLYVALARMWGARTFGLFVFPLTVANLAAMIVDYGYNLQLVRDIGRRPDGLVEAVRQGLSVKYALSVVVALVGWILLSRVSGEQRMVLALLTASSLLNSFATYLNLPLRALQQFDREARLVGMYNILHFVIIGVVALLGADVIAVSAMFVLSRALYVVMSARVFRHATGSGVPWTPSIRSAATGLQSGLVFGLFVALGTLYFQVDTLLIQAFLGARSVGLYQAAVRVLMGALVIPDILSNVYLPAMAAAWRDPATTTRLGRRLSRHLAVAAALIALVFACESRVIGMTLYGTGFGEVAELLPMCGVVIVLRFVASGVGLSLTVGDRQTQRTLVVGVTVLVSLAGNWMLIQAMGLRGAMIAAIGTHVFLLAAYSVLSARDFGAAPVDFRTLLLIGLGSATLLMPTPSPVVGLLLILGVGSAFVALGIRRPEWQQLSEMWKGLLVGRFRPQSS